MSERFVVVVDEDKDLIILCDSQKYTDYNLSDINDVRKLCEVINGINDVKKDNLSKVVEYSRENELLYDVVDGFIALLKLKVEDKI